MRSDPEKADGAGTGKDTAERREKHVASASASLSPRHSQPYAQSDEVDDACVVCLNAILERGKLDCCDHRFCVECILRWSEVSRHAQLHSTFIMPC
jgi:hypothetical protein